MGTNLTSSLCEMKVEIDANDVTSVDDVLLEIGDERWTLLEDVIANRAWIVGIFTSEPVAQSAWTMLSPQLDLRRSPGDATIRLLPEQEWRDSYKAHFHAWQFGQLHWVPVWEQATYKLPAGDTVLWLDPGQAFGTGNHETTRLCVERLVEHAGGENPKGTVVDAGCGSGILALSAAKLGYANVTGFDNDPESVRVSIENASLNDLHAKVPFHVGDLMTGLAGIEADVVMANILANVLMQYAGELTRSVAPGGWLVLSGILERECAQVREAFRALVPDWRVDSRILGDWTDVLLVRPQS
jgi:ribosomal protein L11 methyltransferase